MVLVYGYNVVVIANSKVNGEFKSSLGGVSLTANGAGGDGDITGSAVALGDVTAVAFLGNVDTTITTSGGDAIVKANGEIRKGISAGGTVIAVASLDIIGAGTDDGEGGTTPGGILAGDSAIVSTFGEMKASVSAGVAAYVVAVGDVSADVFGGLVANVNSLGGTITGNVGSLLSASAKAIDDISGNVTSGMDATAHTLANVTGDVEGLLGIAVVYAIGGEISGDVSGGETALLHAYKNISGSATSGGDVVATTFSSQLGSVSAGGSAYVSSMGVVTGAVSAGQDAVATATGHVSGNVSAANGYSVVSSMEHISGSVHAGTNSLVTARTDITSTVNAGENAVVAGWGTVNASISAGSNALVFSGESANLTVDAGASVFVEGAARTVANIDAGQDAVAISGGILSGSVLAGGDAEVVVYNFSNVLVDAGGYAGVSVHGKYQGFVTAGDSAIVFTGEDFHGDVTAGGDAFLISLGNVKGHLSAGKSAVLNAWGGIDLVVVEGDEGAFVWTAGAMNGRVVSEQGEVLVATLGDVLVDVDAFADATILSEGNVSASLYAGKDAFVFAYGDVRGAYESARDASVITYGDFEAGLHAGRDIGRRQFGGQALPGVWAVGDIRGTITADRNIGTHDGGASFVDDYDHSIFSYGDIDAFIASYNTNNGVNDGRIESVVALGTIDGVILAENVIGQVHAGSEITAGIVAPTLPEVIEFDTTLPITFPLPDTPDSIAADVQLDLEALRAALVQARLEYLLLVATEHAVNEDLINAARAELAEALVEYENQFDPAEDEVYQAIAEGVEEALDKFEEQQKASVTSLKQRIKTSLSKKAELESIREKQYQERKAEFKQEPDVEKNAAIAIEEADAAIDQARRDALKVFSGRRDNRKIFFDTEFDSRSFLQKAQDGAAEGIRSWIGDEALVNMSDTEMTVLVYGGVTFTVLATPILGPTNMVAQGAFGAGTLYLSITVGASYLSDGVSPGPKLDVLLSEMKQGAVAGALIGIGGLALGKTLGLGGRVLGSVGGKTGQFVGKAFARINRACFVGDTLVLMDTTGTHKALIGADQPASGSGGTEWNIPLVLLAAAAVPVALSGRKKRPGTGKPSRRRRPVKHGKALDDVFSNEALLDELWCPLPGRPHQATPVASESRSPGQPSARDSHSRFGKRSLWATAWLLLAGLLFYCAMPSAQRPALESSAVARGDAPPSIPTVDDRPSVRPGSSTARDSAHAKPIRDVRCGDRINATNPELSDSERTWQEPDPAHWRHIQLALYEPDGSLTAIELLRPRSWHAELTAATGELIWLDLPELGAEGPAEVLAIRPCPVIPPGTGPIVTGTFRHEAANVVDLSVEGQPEPIGVTSNHPVWSEDRQAFVAVSELRIGEHLQDEHGRNVRVTSILPRGPPQAVYNLEVHGEHVYRVTTAGLLVHNTKAGAVKNGLGRLKNGAGRVADRVKRTAKRLWDDELGAIGRPRDLANFRAAQQARDITQLSRQLDKVSISRMGITNRLRNVASGTDIHHIATPYGKWGTRFRRLFQPAGVDIQSAFNKVRIKGHAGGHGWYNRYIFNRLSSRVANSANPKAYRAGLIDELLELRWQLKNTDLGDLIRATASQIESMF